MKRDKKTDQQAPQRKLKLDRHTVRQLENQDLEQANGGLMSACGPLCSIQEK